MTNIIANSSALETTWRNARPTTEKLALDRALLVRPNAFGFAAESARDNTYMNEGVVISRELAMIQHADMAEELKKNGISSEIFESSLDSPDAVYPNNVFATTSDRLIVGKMLHAVRAKEAVHPMIRSYFSKNRKLFDLSTLEESYVCELTGSIIIDHARSFGFCGLTQRCTSDGALKAAEALNLENIYVFPLKADEYHTNICLSILAGRAAVVAPSSFLNSSDARAICSLYGEAGHLISEDEKNNFVGNCLAISSETVMMSSRAYLNLSKPSRLFFEKNGFNLVHVDISELEKGGGSLRCLIAEIFD